VSDPIPTPDPCKNCPLNPIKPGFRTSEAIGGVAVIASLFAWITDASTPVQIAGLAAIGVIGAAYMISRAITKKQ